MEWLPLLPLVSVVSSLLRLWFVCSLPKTLDLSLRVEAAACWKVWGGAGVYMGWVQNYSNLCLFSQFFLLFLIIKGPLNRSNAPTAIK